MALPFEARITAELKEAIKAKEQLKMDCLRAMKSALMYKEGEKQGDLSEDEGIAVFQTMIKQRRDSVDQFEKGGRPELAAKEKLEIEVIQTFLPTQLSEGELKGIIQQVIQATGAQGIKDLGKVMKDLKAKVAGKADGKLVADLTKAALGA